MKGGRDKRSVRVEFVLTEAEAALIKERMAELGITNLSAYLRKMAVDGYIVQLDMSSVVELVKLLRSISSNVNQIAQKVNAGAFTSYNFQEVVDQLGALHEALCRLTRSSPWQR